MPVYNQHNFISDLKLGIVDVSKMFKGHVQVYPNQSLISGLAFTESSISNASQTTPFVVTGTEDAEYTLSGSSGATAPSGTHVIPASGSNSHNISVSAQGTGASARNPRVDLTTVSSNTPTALSPPSLQAYDTVSQAAGPPPAYTHSLSWSVSGPSSSFSTTVGFNSYSGTYPMTSKSVAVSQGSSDYFYIYLYPDSFKEFSSASNFSISGLPSWATHSDTYVYNSTNNHMQTQYSYIRLKITITGQSSNQSASFSISTNATDVVVTFNKILLCTDTSYSGTFSQNNFTGTTFTSPGNHNPTFTFTVNDGGSGESAVDYNRQRNSTFTYNNLYDICSTPTVSGTPAANGDSVTVTVPVSIPAYRASRTAQAGSSAATSVWFENN
jgi:hypothetical protein